MEKFDDRDLFDFINISFETQEFSLLKIFRKVAKKAENEHSISFKDVDNFIQFLLEIDLSTIEFLLKKFKLYQKDRNTVKFFDLNNEYLTDYWESKSHKTFISILKGLEIIKLIEKIEANANTDKNDAKDVVHKIMKYKQKYKVGVQEKLDLVANSNNIGISKTRDPFEDYIIECLEVKLQIQKKLKTRPLVIIAIL